MLTSMQAVMLVALTFPGAPRKSTFSVLPRNGSAAISTNDTDTVDTDTLTTDGTTKISLKVQLERGLRAMRPVEFQFLQEVLQQVKAKKLPQDLVEQAFLWAQKQRTYRVQYFEKALRALAKQNNVAFKTKVSSFDPGFNTDTN